MSAVGLWDGTRRAWEHLDPLPELPDGWRWEERSNGGVELYDTSGLRGAVSRYQGEWAACESRYGCRSWLRHTRLAAARALVDAVVPRAAAADDLPDPSPYRWDVVDELTVNLWDWNGDVGQAARLVGTLRREGSVWEATAPSAERMSGKRLTRPGAAELLLQYVRGREEQAPSTDDGLPAMAEGSRWCEASEMVCDADTEYCGVRGGGAFFRVGCGKFHTADVRHALARHDRARGRYWRDRVRALALTLCGQGWSDGAVDQVLKLLEEADG